MKSTLIVILLLLSQAFAADEHDHAEGESEENASVGSEKGITEVNQRLGFKLSPEAKKNFGLSTLKLKGDGPWTISKNSIVHSANEVNVFRVRSEFYKSIDFDTVKKTESGLVIDSDDLREGDEIVTSGLGFLKIAELAATGGVAHGHSH